MKRMTLLEARHLVGKLDPVHPDRAHDIDQRGVDNYEAIMRSGMSIGDFCKTMEGTANDCRTLRDMMVAELCGKAREAIVYQLMVKHEHMLRHIRVQQVLDHHPTLAVYWDKMTRTKYKGKAMNTAPLQGIWGAAWGAAPIQEEA
jgi:hypothetical protein